MAGRMPSDSTSPQFANALHYPQDLGVQPAPEFDIITKISNLRIRRQR
jgi:hypothetical protein